MASNNKNEQFKEIFGEYAEIRDNGDLILRGDFVGSDREANIVSSEDAGMLSTMLCCLPRSYSLTLVARTANKMIKPSYTAHAIATVRVLTNSVEQLENLFSNGVNAIDESEEQDNVGNNN